MRDQIASALTQIVDALSTDDGSIEAELGIERGICEPFDYATVRSYDDAGILTTDAGFVITLQDGSEFQVTVVQSRAAGRGY